MWDSTGTRLREIREGNAVRWCPVRRDSGVHALASRAAGAGDEERECSEEVSR